MKLIKELYQYLTNRIDYTIDSKTSNEHIIIFNNRFLSVNQKMDLSIKIATTL